jgi:hypothetical protein
LLVILRSKLNQFVYDVCDYQGDRPVALIWISVGAVFAALVFLVLWLRERRRAQIECVAYGLRGNEDSDENTKTNITQMESSYLEAISKLEDLGQIKQDEWGNWIWVETGKPVGEQTGQKD